MSSIRSLLFAPGNHPKRVDKAFTLAADAVILDLEDACPVSEKVATRSAVVTALQRPRRSLGYVRVNALSTEFGYGDIQAVVRKGVDGIVLTKVNGPDDVMIADWLMTQVEREQRLPNGKVDLIPLIETAAGIVSCAAIARATRRVKRLAFGAGDFTLDLAMRWTREETELLPFRTALTLASRAAGIEAPIDLAWLDTKDSQGFTNSLCWARTLGFQGKLCIHPDHVALINHAFTPTEAEIVKAKRIVEAFSTAEAQGSAAITVDGALVDYAIVIQAQRTLAAAEQARVSV